MGRMTHYEYDALGRLTKETDPLLVNTLYAYDANGNIASKRDGKGVTTGYVYDALNRLVRLEYPGGDVTSYSYDAVGNRLTMSDTIGHTLYSHDVLNRLVSVEDPYGQTVGYQYDQAGRRTRLIYPGNKAVDYGYDAAGRLISVVDWLNNQTDFDYDAAGQLVSQINGNGTTVDRQYDPAGRLVQLQNKKSGGSVISSHNFTLDPVGNRTGVTETLPLTPVLSNQSLTFTHNAGHQVIEDDLRDYAYDLNGNRSNSDDGATLTTYVYNPMDRLTYVGDGMRMDTYRYNGDGALLAAVRNGSEVRYVLDTAGGMPNILAEANAAGVIQRYYIYGNGLLYALDASDNTARHYHYDAIGNTLALTNDEETLTDAYAYGPYGEAAGSSGSTSNRFRYVGQFGVMQEENNLMFMRARFYDPITKRFIAKDPISGTLSDSQSINPYGYVSSNPLIFSDPLGLIKWMQLASGILQTAGGVMTISGSLALASTGVAAPLAIGGFVVGGSVAVGGFATIADAFSNEEHFTGTPIQAVIGSTVAATTNSQEMTDTAITFAGYGETAVSLAVSATQIGVDIGKLRQAKAGADVSKYLHQVALDKSPATAGRIGGFTRAANSALSTLKSHVYESIAWDIIVPTIQKNMATVAGFIRGKI
jgi:RHS repeat-associated protein